MSNKFYRIVAKLCIIAHLNLVIPPYHVAYAGDEIADVQDITTFKKIPMNPRCEGFEEAEPIGHPQSSPFNFENTWDATPSFKSFISSLPFILFASLLEGGEPIAYLLASFASILLFDKFVAPQTTRMFNTARSLVSSQPDWVTKLVMAFALMVSRVAADPTVNGGQEVYILRDNSSLVNYSRTTAPFVKGVDPDQICYSMLRNSVPVNAPYNNTYRWFFKKNITDQIIEFILNSTYNITLTSSRDDDTIYFKSTAKALETFMTNLSFLVPPQLTFSQIFSFCPNETGCDISELLHGLRHFDLVQKDHPDPNSKQRVILYSGVGFFLAFSILSSVGVIGYYRYREYEENRTDEDRAQELMGLFQNNRAVSYDSLPAILDQIKSVEMRQQKAWEIIQKVKWNAKNLFNHCLYIGKGHSCYNKAIDTQVKCLGEMLNLGAIGPNFKDVFSQKLASVEDKLRRQDITWQYIQKYQVDIRKKDLGVLFKMCNLIEDHEEKIAEAEEKRVIELTQEPETATTDEKGKELLLPEETDQNLSLVKLKKIVVRGSSDDKENTRLKCKNDIDVNIETLKEISASTPDTMTTSPTTTCPCNQESERKEPLEEVQPSIYEKSLSLQAECLMAILAQEKATERSSERSYILANNELDGIESIRRRQDLIMHLVTHSNLHSEAKSKLCDQIQKSHPQYVRARIEKAHLIYANQELDSEDRFKQAMLILIALGDDKEAKDVKRDLLTQYWESYIQEELPLYINPLNEDDLKQLISNVKNRKTH